MTRARSWLFVPGDDTHKIGKALAGPADRIILDLEDAVAPANRAVARESVANTINGLTAKDWARVCVRINPWQEDTAKDDLQAMRTRLPASIMLPKIAGIDDLRAVDAALSEVEQDTAQSMTDVIALVTETVSMTATLSIMPPPPKRVSALTWGGEDLSAALGASANKYANGRWLPTFEFARVQCLLTAKRFGLHAIDTLYTNFRDTDGMRRHADEALRDGFDGVLAVHPAQLDPIHAAFTPDAASLEHARRVVAAFAAHPDAGALQLDGKMIDRPHLIQAQKILDRLG
ncbi:MAG: CoA ester lyase [Pseudomonadota bacterium]